MSVSIDSIVCRWSPATTWWITVPYIWALYNKRADKREREREKCARVDSQNKSIAATFLLKRPIKTGQIKSIFDRKLNYNDYKGPKISLPYSIGWFGREKYHKMTLKDQCIQSSWLWNILYYCIFVTIVSIDECCGNRSDANSNSRATTWMHSVNESQLWQETILVYFVYWHK